MTMREKVESKRVWVIAGAVVALLVGGFMTYRGVNGPAPNLTGQMFWYYDLNTSKLFLSPDRLPPFETASGKHQGEPAGVRAYVYSCGECSDEASRFAATIAKLPPEALEKWKAKGSVVPSWKGGFTGLGDPSEIEGDMLVKRPQDKEWISASSEDGQELTGSGGDCPDGKPARGCGDPLLAN